MKGKGAGSPAIAIVVTLPLAMVDPSALYATGSRRLLTEVTACSVDAPATPSK